MSDTRGLLAGLLIAAVLFIHGLAPINRKRKYRPVELRIDDEALYVDGRSIARREQIVSGVVVPRKTGPPWVRLSRSGLRSNIELEVPNEAEGRRLLQALGFDATQRVATFRGSSPVYTKGRTPEFALAGSVAIPFFSWLAASSLQTPSLGFAVTALTILLCSLLFLSRRKIEVGTDGLLLRWLTSKRFVPWSEVDDVYVTQTGFGRFCRRTVRLVRTNGERVDVPIVNPRIDAGRAEMVAQRIRNALASYRESQADPAAALQRRGRNGEQWIHGLRNIGAGADGSLRTAPLSRDRLWRIVQDASSEPQSRAAAAVALATEIDEPDRQQLNAVARATAAPKLRIALEAAANGDKDETELAALLEAVQLEEQAAKRSSAD